MPELVAATDGAVDVAPVIALSMLPLPLWIGQDGNQSQCIEHGQTFSQLIACAPWALVIK